MGTRSATPCWARPRAACRQPPRGAFVALVCGDEIALIVAAEVREKAKALAKSAFKALRGRRIPVGATIGGAVCPEHGHDAKTLLINADIALYRAKVDARVTLLFFDPP